MEQEPGRTCSIVATVRQFSLISQGIYMHRDKGVHAEDPSSSLSLSITQLMKTQGARKRQTSGMSNFPICVFLPLILSFQLPALLSFLSPTVQLLYIFFFCISLHLRESPRCFLTVFISVQSLSNCRSQKRFAVCGMEPQGGARQTLLTLIKFQTPN